MPVCATLTPTTLARRIQQSNDSEYMTAAQLMARYGVSHMWLIRRMAKDGFPKPSYFGRLRFWRRTEVEQWERSKAVAS
jgi:predicted DNA-binding transcriptional regulator AlpA